MTPRMQSVASCRRLPSDAARSRMVRLRLERDLVRQRPGGGKILTSAKIVGLKPGDSVRLQKLKGFI